MVTLAGMFPEHEKMGLVREDSQKIGEFLEWLRSKGLVICTYQERHEGYWPANMSINQWLADYCEIDLRRIDQEKRLMLEIVRREQPSRFSLRGNMDFDKERTERLQKAYDEAVERGDSELTFDGNVLVIDYVKYLLQYLKGELEA